MYYRKGKSSIVAIKSVFALLLSPIWYMCVRFNVNQTGPCLTKCVKHVLAPYIYSSLFLTNGLSICGKVFLRFPDSQIKANVHSTSIMCMFLFLQSLFFQLVSIWVAVKLCHIVIKPNDGANICVAAIAFSFYWGYSPGNRGPNYREA